MTNAEFDTWLADYSARFPDSGHWFQGKDNTLNLWFKEVFSKLPLADCLEANRRLMTSSEPIEAYQRETIVQRVSKLARVISWERSEAAKPPELRQPKMRYSVGERPMAEVFREMLAAKGIRLGMPHPRPNKHNTDANGARLLTSDS